MHRLAKADLDAAARLSVIRELSAGTAYLFSLRYLFMAVGFALAYVITEQVSILVLSVLYLPLDIFFLLHGRRAEQYWSSPGLAFMALVLHRCLLVASYDLIAVMIAFQGNPAGYLCAAFLLIAHAFHMIAVRTVLLALMIPDLVAIVLSAEIIGFVALAEFARPERIILTIGLTILCVFFVIAALHANRLHARLRETSGRLVLAQRTELIGRLTGGIAHDFNNLLTVMRGNLDLIREVPERERPALLAEIETAAYRGGELIARLSQSSRTTDRTQERTQLARAVQEATGLARRTLPANLRLELYINTTASVRGAAVDLEMVVLNLLTNSADAMPDGGSVIIRVTDAPGNRVTLSVEDTGTGMSPEMLARATEAFATSKPIGEGTGLGLAMVQSFADETDATLSIKSSENRGTTVTLHMWRVASAKAA